MSGGEKAEAGSGDRRPHSRPLGLAGPAVARVDPVAIAGQTDRGRLETLRGYIRPGSLLRDNVLGRPGLWFFFRVTGRAGGKAGLA